MSAFAFFSSVDGNLPLPWFGMLELAMKEMLMILGSISLVILLAVAWAVFFSKHRRRESRREESRRRRHSFRKNAMQGMKDVKELVKERHRRRRHEHRPRNPTLAETGGLPPIRRDEPPSSPQTQPQ